MPCGRAAGLTIQDISIDVGVNITPAGKILE
jgi:hypothetical protein